MGGAILMTVGVWSTAVAQLAALGERTRPVQVLLVASSSAVFLAMPPAVAWAAAQHWRGIALSIPDMVRSHGMLNGVIFVPCGLLAWRASERRATRPEAEVAWPA